MTGGGKGIGAAIARKLASMGAHAVICGRTQVPLVQTADSIRAAGHQATAIPCDVSSLSSVESFAAQVKKQFGRCEILVNNAGIGAFASPLHELDPEEWDRVIDSNLRGVFYCIRAFAPIMIAAKSGHIINISSLAGKNALPNGAVYAASKWGLNGLTYSVAEELRPYNIRVATICPGSVDTELSPHEGKNKSKMLLPDDIAHAVAALVTQTPQSFISELLLRPTLKP